MFHQSNLREYQSGHTLLGDLLVTVIAQYEALAVLPIRTLSMEQIGRQMELRAAYDAAGVVGVLVPGQSVTLEAPSGAARVPVTGLRYGRDVDVYGPEVTSYITLSRGARVTLPLLPAGGEATRGGGGDRDEEVVGGPRVRRARGPRPGAGGRLPGSGADAPRPVPRRP